MSEICSQHNQSSYTCPQGSIHVGLIHVVRRCPDEAVVVPCSATLVSVSEDIVSEVVGVCCEESEIGVDISAVPSLSAGLEIVPEQPASEDMDVCDKSEMVVDIPVVVPSAALKSDYEEIATGGVDACEELDIVVDTPAVVPCVEPVPIPDETTTTMDVCEKSEGDGGLPVVANFDPLQTDLGKESVFSEPTILSMDLNLKLLCYCPRLGSRNRSLKFALDERVVRTQVFWRAECMMKYCVMPWNKCLLTAQSVALLGLRSWMRQPKICRPSLLVWSQNVTL